MGGSVEVLKLFWAPDVLRLGVIWLSISALTSCGVSTGGVAPGGSSLTTTAPKACTSSTTTTVDYGVKIGIAATSRGVWSDVKFIPSGVTTGSGTATGNVIQYSTNTGVAYVDTGAQSLKYSFWQGNTFTTETVFGNAAANITYVQLAYLSNAPNTGIPLIFFANGAINSGRIMMAVRSTASLTSIGTWTVSAIDVNGGGVNRALRVSVSPIDQVGLLYQGTTTPTINNIRFAYCSSGCTSSANYVSQSTLGTSRIDAGATATQISLGLAWCQMSSGIYNPAAVYGASATTYQFAICSTGGTNDLSACQLNTGWTRTTATMAATGASGTTSDLYIDASISNDTPNIFIKDVGATRLNTFSTSVGCASVVAGTTYTAFGTSALVGSGIANIANSSMKILKAPDYANATNERYYLVVNDGTTAMRWAASTTNSFNGAWNANALGNIQTVTLNTAGAMGFGADLNTSSKQLITAYGTAAGLFNVTLGVVNDYSSPSDPSSASHVYYQLPVEANGSIQLAAAQPQNVSIAATSTNKPAVAWVDYSSSVATTGRLKYALRGGAFSTDDWQVISLPGVFGTPAPQFPSLAFDHNDRPWVAYWDAQGAGAGRFVLATNTASDGSGSWTSYMFPVTSAGHGAPVAQPAGNTVAVAMSYSSGVASPVVIIVDNGTTKSVRSAKLNPTTGAWSAVTTVGALNLQGGNFLTADWSTGSNLIVVSYQDLSTGAVRVRYSASTDGGTTWPVNGSSPAAVSAISQGEGATIRINPTTGLPSIAYYDRANSWLYFASCTTNCTGTGSPTFTGTTTPVLTGIGIAGLSGAGNMSLLEAALTFSQTGVAHIVYNSGQADLGGLYSISNESGTMPSAPAAVVVPGANGNSTNATATNGGIPWAQSVVRMRNGVLATAYVTPGNFLGVLRFLTG